MKNKMSEKLIQQLKRTNKTLIIYTIKYSGVAKNERCL